MGPAPPLLLSQATLPEAASSWQDTPGKPGPSMPASSWAGPETNGWCKWVFGGTARPRHSPAGSLQLRLPLWATLPSGPPRPPGSPCRPACLGS